MITRTVLVFIMTFLFGLPCFGQQGYTYTQPKTLGDGWETSDLRTQHIDTTLLYKLFTQLKEGDHKLHSILVVTDNQLLIEEYFDGHAANKLHDLRSATKSIRSLLMGIAIDKGFVDDVNDPVSKYLSSPAPEKHLDPRKDRITIRHLLTMSSGLDCNDWDKKSKGQEDKVYRKKDWLQYTLDLPMLHEPGTVSNYCSMGAILVAEIIAQSSGMPIDAFAKKYLFNPLGIENLSWGHTSDKGVIPSGKRLYMTPRDMAKVGQLVLNRGQWQGKQIVSEKWVEESTAPQTKITGIDYGYLWWQLPFAVNGNTIIARTATGNGGQYIMVIPDLSMVAVFTGGAYNSQEDKLPFAILKDVLLPSFNDRD